MGQLVPHTSKYREMNSHQRAALIAIFLWQGSKLSNRDVARLTAITTSGAHKMMTMLAATLPIVFENGHWQWMQKE